MGEISTPVTQDGVGYLLHGDTIVVVFNAPARLHRAQCVFDGADELAARCSGGILALMVVLPASDPPDAATRAENTARLRKLGPSLRKLVTVPTGSSVRISIVRAVMRAIAVLQGSSKTFVVADTVREGIRLLSQGRGPETPRPRELEDDVRSICAALGAQYEGGRSADDSPETLA